MITENQAGSTNQHLIDYGKIMDEAVEKLQMLLEESKALPIRWLTLQLFEGNLYVKNYLSGFIDREVLTSYIHEIEEKVIQIEVFNLPSNLFINKGGNLLMICLKK